MSKYRTVVLGGFATRQTTDADLTSFAPDSDLARAFERVVGEFSGGGARIQVIVDAGEGGDVLSSAGLAAADAIAAVDAETSEVEIDAFSQAILADQLQSESEDEMPRLLGVSLLLIVGILAFQYRSASDVALGFAGLIVTIVWMFGFGVLLGPDFLGVVGPFTQVSTAVPVLLVGLGIDYAIHLNSRYREEQNHGVPSAGASATAVRAVGGALVLATVTTVVGFTENPTRALEIRFRSLCW